MDMAEIVKRTAYQAGATEDLADRLIESFLHELRAAMHQGEAVRLGEFGTFHGTSFTPGVALTAAVGSPFSDTEGYEDATAPRDS